PAGAGGHARRGGGRWTRRHRRRLRGRRAAPVAGATRWRPRSGRGRLSQRTSAAGPRMSAGGRQDRGAGARAVAARVLDAVLHGGHSLKAELAAALPQLPDPRDRALVEAIVFAALRQRARCEAALAQWMPRPPGRRDGILRALLYAGFVQLDALRLPPHAALAATVDAARL